MRQRNFFVGLLFAVLTFTTLTWALGSRHHRWHHGWHHDACYDSSEGARPDRDAPQQRSQDENDSNDKRQQ